jgi:multiple sugar transport system substrate-binding protein
MSSQKRSILALFVLLTSLMILSLNLAQAQEARTLVIWAEPDLVSSMADPASIRSFQGRYLIEQFEAENPGVTVVMEDHGWDETLRQNLLTALMAGTGPDIVVGEAFFQQYADLGALVEINDIIEENRDNLIEGPLLGAKSGDNYYGISIRTAVFGFERNCDVIEAAGFDCENAPATWDELLEQARTITENGGGSTFGYTLQGPAGFSIGSVFRVAVYLAQAGVSLCKDNCTQPNFNDPAAVPVYEFLRELNRYTPPGLTFNPDEGQVYSQLFQGISAYQIAGSWHVGWAADNGCTGCRYSDIPLPEGGQPASLIVGNTIYSILAGSDNIDLAKDWLRFALTDGSQNLAYPSRGGFPATRSALQLLLDAPDTLETTPATVEEQLTTFAVSPASKAYISVLLNSPNLQVLPQWRRNPDRIWTAWNDMFTQILTTEDPIQGILDEYQAIAEAAAQ